MTLCHNCSDTRIEYTGNGTVVDYSFPFQYNTEQDVKVANWDTTLKVWSNVNSTLWSLNSTLITFTTAPADGQKFIIYRCTDLSPLPAQFNAGSSIKAQDLNDNFFVLQSAIEEARCSIERQSEVSEERYLQELSDDTTPQLGGDLDMNGNFISSGLLGVKNQGSQSELRLYCESNNAHYISLKAPAHSAFNGNNELTLPATNGSAGQVLQTNGSGVLDWVDHASLSNLSVTGSAGLSYNGSGVFTYTAPDLTNYLTDYTVTASDLNSISINALSDVNIIGATAGSVLKWNGTHWTAQADNVGSGGGGGIALTDLSASTAPAGSTALTYDNQTGVFTYVPPDLSGYLTSYTVTSSDLGSIPISALQNVSASTPQTNDVLKWDGSTWQPQAESGGSGFTRAQATAISLIFS